MNSCIHTHTHHHHQHHQTTVAIQLKQGFPGSSVEKNRPVNAGDAGTISESGRSPGVGNGTPLRYSCLENSMDRGVWPATNHGMAKSRIRLSN